LHKKNLKVKLIKGIRVIGLYFTSFARVADFALKNVHLRLFPGQNFWVFMEPLCLYPIKKNVPHAEFVRQFVLIALLWYKGLLKMLNFPVSDGRSWALRLTQGEDLIDALESFAKEQELEAAFLWGIGAVSQATLAFYRQLTREYHQFVFSEPLEMLSCTGNLSRREGEAKVHLHGIFSRIHGEVFGGHIQQETIITSAELFIREVKGATLERELDESSGLFLWK
jgi:uncharacterized protein